MGAFQGIETVIAIMSGFKSNSSNDSHNMNTNSSLGFLLKRSKSFLINRAVWVCCYLCFEAANCCVSIFIYKCIALMFYNFKGPLFHTDHMALKGLMCADDEPLTPSMLWLLSSKAQERKDF